MAAFPRGNGRTTGRPNSKLHAACDGHGRPVLLLTEGQAGRHRGAALQLPRLAPVNELIPGRGCGGHSSAEGRSARFRTELAQRGGSPSIPSRRSRKQPIPHDATLHRQRHRIETMVERLNDRRRIAMRCDRCAQTFFAAITLTKPSRSGSRNKS